MLIKGIDNQKLELKIVNYQFPENRNGGHDANWLDIYIKVDSKFGKWEVTDPALSTLEIKEIINWFKALSVNEEVVDHLEFMETNLIIKKIEDKDNVVKLRFYFDLELKPKNALDDTEYYLDANLTKEELKKLSEDLNQELTKFPIR